MNIKKKHLKGPFKKMGITKPKHIRFFGTVIVAVFLLTAISFTRNSPNPNVLGASTGPSLFTQLINHFHNGVKGIQSTNIIQQENSKPGTTGWKVTKPSLHGEIQAYVSADSVNKGENLPLYVSTKQAGNGYVFDMYRLGYYGGKGGRLMWELKYPGYGKAQGYYDPTENTRYPVHCPTCITSLKDSKGQETYITDANWHRTNVISTGNFVSGIYVVKLTEMSTGYQWEVPFVVRDDTRKSDLVNQVPFNTDEAYNIWGGTDLYQNYRLYPQTGKGSTTPFWAFYASFNRPYMQNYGTGYLFAWAYPMARFIEQQGYDVTYTTNNAVALGQTNLSNYKGFISAGHDEYWSYDERQKLDPAIKNGLNIAFFGANDMYWQIRNLPDSHGNPNRYIVEYKDYSNPHSFDPYNISGNPNQYMTTTLFRAKPVSNSEDKILKTMYGSLVSRPTVENFITANTNNWIYKGTNVSNGTSIPGILGVEVDTLYQDGSTNSDDNITIIGQSPFKTQYGTTITAYSSLDELKNGSIIFNASTMDWVDGISDYPIFSSIPESQSLRIMTNNILYRIATGVVPPITLSLKNMTSTSYSNLLMQSLSTPPDDDNESLGSTAQK